MTMLKRVPPKFYRCPHCHVKLAAKKAVVKDSKDREQSCVVWICPCCHYIRNRAVAIPSVSPEAELRVQERMQQD